MKRHTAFNPEPKKPTVIEIPDPGYSKEPYEDLLLDPDWEPDDEDEKYLDSLNLPINLPPENYDE